MGQKEELDKLIADLETKKFRDGESKGLVSSIQKELIDAIRPVLDKMGTDMGNHHKSLGESLTRALNDGLGKLKIQSPQVNVPETKLPPFPEIKIPTPQVTVNVPPQKAPQVNIPPTNFPDSMKISGHSLNWKNPLPVVLTDINGKPYTAGYIGGSGGGFSTVKVMGALTSGGLDMTDETNRALRVNLIAGGAGNGAVLDFVNNTLGAQVTSSDPATAAYGLVVRDINTSAIAANTALLGNTLLVTQSSGAIDSVSIVGNIATLDVKQMSGDMSSMNLQQVGGNSIVVGSGYQDNALRTVQATDSISSVNIVGNLNTLDVKQMSGDTSSTNILQINGNTVSVGDGEVGVGTLRVAHAADFGTSVNIIGNIATLDIKQLSGSTDSMNLLQVGGNSVVVGSGYQDNALRVVNATDSIDSVSIVSNIASLDIKQVSGSTDSMNLLQVNGNTVVVGTGYQDNALRVVHATDAIASTLVQGIAMTTNPTTSADGALAFEKTDKIGRRLNRPIQVRDLIATARVNVITGTETTLLAAGGAGVFLDMITVTAANASTNAVTADFRSVTAGNIEFSLTIPASSTNGIAHPVPWPQGNANNNWTVDLSDDTHNVTFNALFSKEI